ncbi:MAG: hypothetical protein KDJ29_17495 [Hyphomicrobiales bacterium]|nr:hypothetical protein [Hyphomicrobiales bacterium]
MNRLIASAFFAAAAFAAAPAQALPGAAQGEFINAAPDAGIHTVQYGPYGGPSGYSYRRRYNRDGIEAPPDAPPPYGYGYRYRRAPVYPTAPVYREQYGEQPRCYWTVRRYRTYVPHLARDVWQRRRVRVCE